MFALVGDEGKVVQIETAQFPVVPTFTWVDITAVNPKPEHGWSYNGVVFTAPPPAPPDPPKSASPLTAEELAAHGIGKGTITQAEIDAIKSGR